MTLKAAKFTPEVMLGAPRRSPGTPNADASKIAFTVSQHDWQSHESRSEVRVLDVASRQATLVTADQDASNPQWLDLDDSRTLVLLRGAKNGRTELVVGPYDDWERLSYVAGTIGGAADNLKMTRLGRGRYGVAVSALANPDGTMYNAEEAPKPQSTGKLYSSIFVRHWDTWLEPQRQAIWYGSLNLASAAEEGDRESIGKKYRLSKVYNALKGTALESPMPPFGGTDHFDIGPTGLVFVAKDPDLSSAVHTKCNFYLLSIDDFQAESSVAITTINTGTAKGAATSPVFSVDGTSAAFLLQNTDGYEADKNQIYVIPDIRRPAALQRLYATEDGKGSWDQSPTSIDWSRDGASLYLTAERYGRKLLYSVPANWRQVRSLPQGLTTSNTVTGVKPLADGRVFVSSTSFVDGSIYSIVSHRTERQEVQVSSMSNEGATFALSKSQISEIWFPGAGSNPETNDHVHAWVLKPSNFSASKQYPLAFLIHGGPQGSWGNAWSTRWNAAVYAEQGYVVVMPNPTGSTGYGQQFCDDIGQNWGGTPYHDLINCLDYIRDHLDYVDTNRAVALGASYGGYMVNWIQGHELGRRFKALVTHDGIFSPVLAQATDELYFVERELGGRFDTHPQPDSWARWDPSRFVHAWATPHLVIHSERDYRLTVADGLAAFNTLQRRGIASQLLVFPDENHFVLRPENSLRWHEAVLSFVNFYVGLPSYGADDLQQIVKDPVRGAGGEQQRRAIVVAE